MVSEARSSRLGLEVHWPDDPERLDGDTTRSDPLELNPSRDHDRTRVRIEDCIRPFARCAAGLQEDGTSVPFTMPIPGV